MTEKRFYIDKDGDLYDRQQPNNILMLDFGYCEAVYVKEVLDCMNSLAEENEQLKQINRNLGDFRKFITEQNVSNEKERKNLQLQMLRLYNYFENYFEDTMSPNAFGEMWDNVKEDKKWE